MHTEISEYRLKLYRQRRQQFVEQTFKKLRCTFATLSDAQPTLHQYNKFVTLELTAEKTRRKKIQDLEDESSQSTAASSIKQSKESTKWCKKIIRIVHNAIVQSSNSSLKLDMLSVYNEIKDAADKLMQNIDKQNSQLMDELIHETKCVLRVRQLESAKDDSNLQEVEQLVARSHEEAGQDVATSYFRYCLFVCVLVSIRDGLRMCSRPTLFEIEEVVMECLYLNEQGLSQLCYDILVNMYRSAPWLLQSSARCLQPVLGLIQQILSTLVHAQQSWEDVDAFCELTLAFELLTCVIHEMDSLCLAQVLNNTTLLEHLIIIKAMGLITLALDRLEPEDKACLSMAMAQKFSLSLPDQFNG